MYYRQYFVVWPDVHHDYGITHYVAEPSGIVYNCIDYTTLTRQLIHGKALQRDTPTTKPTNIRANFRISFIPMSN